MRSCGAAKEKAVNATSSNLHANGTSVGMGKRRGRVLCLRRHAPAASLASLSCPTQGRLPVIRDRLDPATRGADRCSSGDLKYLATRSSGEGGGARGNGTPRVYIRY